MHDYIYSSLKKKNTIKLLNSIQNQYKTWIDLMIKEAREIWVERNGKME